MVLGFLALGRKTQAGQAGNSQRSEEGILPYRSPVCSKVPGGFSQRRCTGVTGALKVSTAQRLEWHRRPALSGPHQKQSRAGTSTGEGGTEKTGPGGEMKHDQWPTRGHGDPRN